MRISGEKIRDGLALGLACFGFAVIYILLGA
jgi:hypothetical protein